MAVRVGFEPTLEFPLNTLSKRAPSTTRPPHHTPRGGVGPRRKAGIYRQEVLRGKRRFVAFFKRAGSNSEAD